MSFEFLKRWLTRQPAPRPDLHFLVYTRAACPLCEEAWELLVRYQERYGFSLESKNVDEAAELMGAFGNCVPVVAVNGTVRFRGRINEVLLQRIFDV